MTYSRECNNNVYKGLPHCKDAEESDDRPCRPRASIRLEVRVRGRVGLDRRARLKLATNNRQEGCCGARPVCRGSRYLGGAVTIMRHTAGGMVYNVPTG